MTNVENMLGKHQELFFMYGKAHAFREVHELLADEDARDNIFYELYENGSTNLFEKIANEYKDKADAFKQGAFGKSEEHDDE